MSEERDLDEQPQQADRRGGWQRAQEAFKHAQVTAAVAMHVASPMAGPLAQQAHLEPVSNEQQYSQQVREEDLHTAAEWDHLRREQEAGKLVREAEPAKRDPDHGKTAHRHREPGR
jgi:hypothetical protein